MARTELIPEGGGLAFVSPYNPGLVAALKEEIPPESRRWDNAGKRWIVDAKYGNTCAQLASRFLGANIDVPSTVAVKAEVRLLKLEYLGRCKPRQYLTEPTAYGWVGGSWSFIVAESALRSWFEAEPSRPGEKPTLYAVLGIKATVAIDELRSAYRRLARQWHPDVNRDPDAGEQFKAILHAYEILSDPLTRKKYDAGLTLEGSLKDRRLSMHDRVDMYRAVQGVDGYRAPLKCGYVLAEGQSTIKGFAVSKILQWEDIVRADGKVLSTSWPAGADKFEVQWV